MVLVSRISNVNFRALIIRVNIVGPEHHLSGV